jgi:hypothetical protein
VNDIKAKLEPEILPGLPGARTFLEVKQATEDEKYVQLMKRYEAADYGTRLKMRKQFKGVAAEYRAYKKALIAAKPKPPRARNRKKQAKPRNVLLVTYHKSNRIFYCPQIAKYVSYGKLNEVLQSVRQPLKATDYASKEDITGEVTKRVLLDQFSRYLDSEASSDLKLKVAANWPGKEQMEKAFTILLAQLAYKP